MINKIVVAGAGTMGSGIAFCAAQAGINVILFDINASVIAKAKESSEKNISYLLQKQKITRQEADDILKHLEYTTEKVDAIGNLIIEAIVEKLDIKTDLLKSLAEINAAQTILASNTSSLSITALQKNLPHPERVVGMHFFNPAQVMKLVEVVKGDVTSESTWCTVMDLCKRMNKIPVLCTDSPGFIVNRVARHFYLESLHLVEQELATPEQVDAAIENAGFKLGPFKLMDLIGMDINLAVSESLYAAFDNAVRFMPSTLQQKKVAEGKLGRKTGEGFYTYPQKK